MKKSLNFIAIISTFLMLSITAFAYTGDISINQKNISFSNGNFMEGRTVRIYASVTNQSNQDLLGVVRFFDNGNQIGGDQAISIFGTKTDDIFVDWTPNYGNHRIAVKVYPWEPDIDDPSNNWIVTEVFAVQDTDHDGIPNDQDEDDDGDGTPDTEDAFPLNSNEQLDTDGDGVGNNADLDDDNDEVPDEFDDMPLNPNESLDTDHDGIGNVTDTDDDGDGLSDSEEENLKTDPLNTDTDQDSANDSEDAFPLNPDEQLDTDNDNIGNNTDSDDDNDGLPDTKDEFPLNKGPVIKLNDESPTIGLNEQYTFDASPSFDEDGEITTYSWEIDNNTPQEGNYITHKFSKTGDHNVRLTITDNSGQSRTTEFTVSVLNLRYYKQIILIILIILLAIGIYFKYIAEAKNPKAKK